MDTAFRDIAALSGEKGCRAILDDAAWYFATDPAAHTAFVEQLASLANHGERAMTTFLDHPACWRRATRFFHADALPAWRKRTHLPHTCPRRWTRRAWRPSPPASARTSAAPRAGAPAASWNRSVGARWTISSPTPRTTRSTVSNGWTASSGSGRTTRPSRSSTSIRNLDGTLDVNIRGARPAVEPLQGLFAATILKQPELPPDPTDDRVYDLNPLREPGFEFVYDSGSGIQDVVVTTLRLASRVTTGGPPHARSRCGWPPHGGLRPARAAGLGGTPPPLPRHPGRAGGVGDHGHQPAAHSA